MADTRVTKNRFCLCTNVLNTRRKLGFECCSATLGGTPRRLANPSQIILIVGDYRLNGEFDKARCL